MPAERDPLLLITCEHGGRRVPPELRHCFRGAGDVLRTHRGYDLGILPVASTLAERLAAPLLWSETSRLVVDLNRSPDNPQLFSEFTRNLPDEQRREILSAYYSPYRSEVERFAAAAEQSGQRLVHLSMHSFTDELNGRPRALECGVLFDPGRAGEAALADRLIGEVQSVAPTWRVRENQPYLGTDDGLTTHLRKLHDAAAYTGIEIELRQGMLATAARRNAAALALTAGIRSSLRR